MQPFLRLITSSDTLAEQRGIDVDRAEVVDDCSQPPAASARAAGD